MGKNQNKIITSKWTKSFNKKLGIILFLYFKTKLKTFAMKKRKNWQEKENKYILLLAIQMFALILYFSRYISCYILEFWITYLRDSVKRKRGHNMKYSGKTRYYSTWNISCTTYSTVVSRFPTTVHSCYIWEFWTE